MQINHADEDTRRLDQQRLIPGWNYCQFFILKVLHLFFNIKESLSFTYELMGLFDEALVQYDELEAGFFQTLYGTRQFLKSYLEQALPWFKKFGGTLDGDDSGNILDFTKKNYRQDIYQNSTTIFDFRIYLFARQCALLKRLQQPLQFLTRCLDFINSFSKTLNEYKVSLIPFFRESWVFSGCMAVIQSYEDLVGNLSTPMNPTTFRQCEAIQSTLLHLARIQLDKFGLLHGMILKPLHPFSKEVLVEDNDLNQYSDSLISTTNLELKSALGDVGKFDELYIVICHY